MNNAKFKMMKKRTCKNLDNNNNSNNNYEQKSFFILKVKSFPLRNESNCF